MAINYQNLKRWKNETTTVDKIKRILLIIYKSRRIFTGNLEAEQNKANKLNRLMRRFSPEVIENDTVVTNIDDRLGTCIIKGKFGGVVRYDCTICYHGFTFFMQRYLGERKKQLNKKLQIMHID